MTLNADVAVSTTPRIILPKAARALSALSRVMSRADHFTVIDDVARNFGEANSGNLPTILRRKISWMPDDVGSHSSPTWLDRQSAWTMTAAMSGEATTGKNKPRQFGLDMADLRGRRSTSNVFLRHESDGSFAQDEFSITDAGSAYLVDQGTNSHMPGFQKGQSRSLG